MHAQLSPVHSFISDVLLQLRTLLLAVVEAFYVDDAEAVAAVRALAAEAVSADDRQLEATIITDV